ncbi:acetyl/propionyl/methylcrotonyl-CoA carboxylase subunit alpha [Patulibacter defluvii]|uniref:acetyl/propionyl/methylcrotonyl-CoA carboxylase subunit alpha n=1 Tax=Patulibacter defluvii TaxID=3095358 RepID=UPI002A74F507|nr:biotin carboxylase N-terminal domain-containing protein [Patulibacter sp. DM4]
MSAAPIRRLLVANRGEIARRIFATCRRLGIETVAVHSEPDGDAPFVREADLAVALGGAAPAESYLRADAIIAAARAAGADAIHPGYGFLSEDAGFAAAVAAAGLRWIGPTPQTIEAVGSKLRARELMEAAGVPVLPGGRIDERVAEDALAEQAAAIGFPLLVKASAGGGGRGMRLVEEPAGLVDAVAAARHEAAAAFGDGTVFLERYVTRPRHVEVQILGDVHGTVSALPERDCSIQRRHQKLIEESPAPAIGDDVRAALADAARKAAGALGYVSAGTVEFVLAADGSVFFLEVNTRLQVEHPVTELVVGLDLVELQLRIAEGEPLPAAAIDPPARGHAIEARLVAEDPAAGWLPQTGLVEQFGFAGATADPAPTAATTGLRVDTGVEPGSVVSPHYDSMLAKVIVHAPTRALAIRRLADALRRAELAGPRTARDLLVRTLESTPFATAVHDTQLLDGPALDALAAPLVDGEPLRRAAAAAALAGQAARRAAAGAGTLAPSGWRNVPAVDQAAVYDADGAGEDGLAVAYRLDRGGRLATLTVDGAPLGEAVELVSATADAVELRIDGLRHRFATFAGADALWVATAAGQVALRERPRFPDHAAEAAAGSLTAPLPGTVLRVLASAGDAVVAGQPLVVLEAMKMEHEVTAPVDGTLAELPVAVGDQVDGGQVLAVVDGDDGG